MKNKTKGKKSQASVSKKPSSTFSLLSAPFFMFISTYSSVSASPFWRCSFSFIFILQTPPLPSPPPLSLAA
jgi:hypothetical protein